MNLIEYANILKRRGWIMLLLAVLAAVATFAFSQTITPVYRSTQVVLLQPSRSDLGLTEAALRLMNNRRAYLDSNIVAARIIDRLNLDFSPSYLRSRTTITANRDSLTMQIDVDLPAPNAQAASELISPIAAAWGEELILQQQRLNDNANSEDRINAQAQDFPRLGLLRPQPRLYAVIGGVAGFLLGAVIVFVLEYLESNIIKRRQEIENLDGMKVLAVIPTE